jgi:ribonuclease R
MSAKRIATLNKKLPEIAEHCSVTERSADDAERDTDKYKIAQYMKTKVGQEFDGIVSSVTVWGMYVELENTVEGLVSIRDMYDDVYIYDEENLLLFGDHTHKTYTIGDKVKIKVTGASLSDKTVDFEVVEKYENR